MTSVEDILVQALKKANVSDQNPTNYCLVEVENGQPIALFVCLFVVVIEFSIVFLDDHCTGMER